MTVYHAHGVGSAVFALRYRKPEESAICSRCGAALHVKAGQVFAPWGTVDGAVVCHQCIGEEQRAAIAAAQPGHRFTLYLEEENGKPSALVNFGGGLRIPVRRYRRSRHNIAGGRVDVWATLDGVHIWGVHMGQYNQIARCRVVKG